MGKSLPDNEAADHEESVSVFKGIVDIIGVDAVLGAMGTRHQLDRGFVKMTIIDAGDSQLALTDGIVEFVRGEWRGRLTFSQVRDALAEYIHESLGYDSS